MGNRSEVAFSAQRIANSSVLALGVPVAWPPGRPNNISRKAVPESISPKMSGLRLSSDIVPVDKWAGSVTGSKGWLCVGYEP